MSNNLSGKLSESRPTVPHLLFWFGLMFLLHVHSEPTVLVAVDIVAVASETNYSVWIRFYR